MSIDPQDLTHAYGAGWADHNQGSACIIPAGWGPQMGKEYERGYRDAGEHIDVRALLNERAVKSLQQWDTMQHSHGASAIITKVLESLYARDRATYSAVLDLLNKAAALEAVLPKNPQYVNAKEVAEFRAVLAKYRPQA